MFGNFIKKIDGLTVAVIGSLLVITSFAIGAINYFFVDRILLDDAQSLSHSAAGKIHEKLFNSDGLGSYVHLSKVIHKSSKGVRKNINANVFQPLFQADRRSNLSLPKLTALRLEGSLDLKNFLNTHLKAQAYFYELDSYGIYLPYGDVYLSDKIYADKARRKNYSSGSSILTSVSSVFENERSLYSFQENTQTSLTRHFVPLKHKGRVIAVVLLEARNTSAGAKMADAVSDAISSTMLTGLPFIFLLLLVAWSRFNENQLARQEINFLSHHDHLTGLLNRAGYYQSVGQTFRSKLSNEEKFAVFLVDLDRFHTINADVGATCADEILKTVVERLETNSPTNAVVARLSGDEFAIICPDISSPEVAVQFAKVIKDSLAVPHRVENEEIICTGSLGLVFAPDNGSNGQTLIKNAKLALYRAKANGGNTFSFFEPEMDKELQERRILVRELANAINNEEFEIYYQPQVELSDRSVKGYEALLRWNHPKLGMVSPVAFIPVLEDTKMIIEVGEYVLKRACREALTWSNDERVAVNLSPVQFEHQDIVAMVETALEESGLAPERLELEITESILMSDTNAAMKILAALKDLGVHIAMDDFGTGFSSLSYISTFDFDKIKIDRSFVSCIQSDERARAIITTVIGLGRTLDIMITAEGIETSEQLLLIQAAGCHFGQGYLFGKPEPLAKILENQSETIDSNHEEEADVFASQVA